MFLGKFNAQWRRCGVCSLDIQTSTKDEQIKFQKPLLSLPMATLRIELKSVRSLRILALRTIRENSITKGTQGPRSSGPTPTNPFFLRNVKTKPNVLVSILIHLIFNGGQIFNSIFTKERSLDPTSEGQIRWLNKQLTQLLVGIKINQTQKKTN